MMSTNFCEWRELLCGLFVSSSFTDSLFSLTLVFSPKLGVVSGSKEDFSILDFDFVLFGRDYSPPSPPPPPPSVSCEEDLHGIRSLNTSC